jgi:integrase
LSEAEYRAHGRILGKVEAEKQYALAAQIICQSAMTGCRRKEIVSLKWSELDAHASCLSLEDSKERKSIRPVGLPVIEYLQSRRAYTYGTYVFPGHGENNAFGAFANHRDKIFTRTQFEDFTDHVQRHSFASVTNDLRFTQITIAALMGHVKGTVTSTYVHTLDAALVIAADRVASYVQGLLDGVEDTQTVYAPNDESCRADLSNFLTQAIRSPVDTSAANTFKAA